MSGLPPLTTELRTLPEVRFVPLSEVINVTRSERRMRKTDCRLTWLKSLLMRDEYRHGHRGQYAARRTAKYEFA